MKNRTETNGMRALESFVKYFSAVMALVYAAAGIFLLLRANMFFNVPDYYSVPLGLMLTSYGVFRGYRVYNKYFQTHEKEY